MPALTLTAVPPALLKEWQAYAEQSGLPLEYLILEAVTYSVRSDRLGVEAAKLVCAQRQKALSSAKKHIQKNGPSALDDFQAHPSPVPTPTAQEYEEPDDEQVVRHLPKEYMDSNESSAALEDFVPRNL